MRLGPQTESHKSNVLTTRQLSHLDSNVDYNVIFVYFMGVESTVRGFISIQGGPAKVRPTYIFIGNI